SAFQQQKGKEFNTDNQEGSAGDMAFLTAYARQLPSVDWNHVGVVGHSAGAQAALMYGSQIDCTVDAIVSLDTTQDYHSVTDPVWETLTTKVTKNRENLKCTVLMVADPH